jgi:2-alkyl-3-oxoalkanoate reductase
MTLDEEKGDKCQVAVIGANGFIGSRLIEMFHLGNVCSLVPIVRDVRGLARLSRFDMEGRLADARDPAALAKALEGCDAMVDCTVGMPRDIEVTARSLVTAASRAGIRRIIYLSSASVHGQNPSTACDENTPLSDRQEMPYNNAKVRAEKRLLADAARNGVELFVLRPSIVFGPRDRWITTLASELRRGGAWLIEEGSGVCNTIYVDNLVESIRCCLKAPARAAGSPYLVTDAEALTWRDVYEASASALGIDFSTVQCIATPPDPARGRAERMQEIRVSALSQRLINRIPVKLKRVVKGAMDGLRQPHSHNPWASLPKSEASPSREMVLLQRCRHRFPITKATRELGYVPVVSFQEALKRTIEWLRWAET